MTHQYIATPDRDELRAIVKDWIRESGDNDLLFAVAYLMGYHGGVTESTWEELWKMVKDGTLTVRL